MHREHAMFFEGPYEAEELHAITQKTLRTKATDNYTVRRVIGTNPGARRTTPTLMGTFDPGSNTFVDVGKWQVTPPLPDTYYNPQDAVHRLDHPSAAGNRHQRKSLPTVRERIIGAGGVNVQQVFEPSYEILPGSHPMAGGNPPQRLDLRQLGNGQLPYQPMSSGETSQDPRVPNRNRKKFRDYRLRESLAMRYKTAKG